jgi:hypothetical protein
MLVSSEHGERKRQSQWHCNRQQKGWDITGQEKYQDLSPLYFTKGHIAFLVFDHIDKEISVLRAAFHGLTSSHCDSCSFTDRNLEVLFIDSQFGDFSTRKK